MRLGREGQRCPCQPTNSGKRKGIPSGQLISLPTPNPSPDPPAACPRLGQQLRVDEAGGRTKLQLFHDCSGCEATWDCFRRLQVLAHANCAKATLAGPGVSARLYCVCIALHFETQPSSTKSLPKPQQQLPKSNLKLDSVRSESDRYGLLLKIHFVVCLYSC